MATISITPRKIFVANKASNLDYKEAENFGEIVPVTRGYIDFTNIQKLSHEINKSIYLATEDDYLLLSGHNLVCAMVVWLWIKKFGSVQVLHFDKKEERYVIVSLTNDSTPVLI